MQTEASDGLFCHVVPSMLTKVSVSSGRATNISIQDGLIEIGPELFEEEEQGKGLVERVLKACGESIQAIELRIYDADPVYRENSENRCIHRLKPLLVQYSPAVERLGIDLASMNLETASTLVAVYSSRLRSIEWYKCGNSPGLPD